VNTDIVPTETSVLLFSDIPEGNAFTAMRPKTVQSRPSRRISNSQAFITYFRFKRKHTKPTSIPVPAARSLRCSLRAPREIVSSPRHTSAL
jgi:hypothetical protein